MNENDVALAVAIHLCERYVSLDGLLQNEAFVKEKVGQLNNVMPERDVETVFGKN